MGFGLLALLWSPLLCLLCPVCGLPCLWLGTLSLWASLNYGNHDRLSSIWCFGWE